MKIKHLEKRIFIYWDKRGCIFVNYDTNIYHATGSFDKKKTGEIKRILSIFSDRQDTIDKLRQKKANKFSYCLLASTAVFLSLFVFVLNYFKP